MPTSLRCYLVEKKADGTYAGAVQTRSVDELAPGDVLVRVRYSSINYKDALAATGQAGIAKTFPHVPGIDAAGEVVSSHDSRFPVGTEVITTGHEIGVERWGGWGEYIRVPGDWLLPPPSGLNIREAMILGTAGFTAAQCVQALVGRHITPERGEVLVTGSTGGVASLAIMMLHNLGYRIVAVTGKPDQQHFLKSLGATEVVGRDFLKESDRPLLAGRFAGAIDTVGGPPLAAALKMMSQRGCIACCGLTAGTDVATTVYPFILRGVTLAGIDSVWCPDEERPALWKHLATDWKPKHLDQIENRIGLDQISDTVQSMLAGKHVGRTVIDHSL